MNVVQIEVLRISDVCRMTGLSRSSIGRRIKAGQFPEGFLLGGEGSRSIGWFRHDVEAWLVGRWRAAHGEAWEESLAA